MHFDKQLAIKTAWEVIWKCRLPLLAKGETGFRNDLTYVTASDLVTQVRVFAEAQAEGKPWPTEDYRFGSHWGSSVRISGNLLHDCRDWLLKEAMVGRINTFNHGRGHISGMRFRPLALPAATETEKKTLAQKQARQSRPSLRHYAKTYGGRALCVRIARANRAMWGRSKAQTTSEKNNVTCARCLNLLNNFLCEPTSPAVITQV